jgi:hypothetical protein
VNAIAPGMVRTSDNVAMAGANAAYVELGSLAEGVLALADPAGSATGQVVPITPHRD